MSDRDADRGAEHHPGEDDRSAAAPVPGFVAPFDLDERAPKRRGVLPRRRCDQLHHGERL
jgi:hypothetical protein